MASTILCLRIPGEPGAQVGAAGEGGLAGERRDEGLLHRVLGSRGVAQLQAGKAQQVGPQGFELLAEVVLGGHGDEGILKEGVLKGPGGGLM